jgi:cobalt-zinc-cadmium efflux system protein
MTAMTAARAHRTRLSVVFALTLVVLVLEIVGSWLTDSLALLADAGHLLTDVVGLGLALGAIWFAGRPASEGRTFGYLRLEILAAVVNAVLLLGIAAIVVIEAIRRLGQPPDIAAGPMLVIALIGGAVNLVGVLLLHAPARESLNLRGAYLEVVGDLLGSVAVVIAALVIVLTGWTPIDALASLAIGVLILPRTLRLLREAVDVLLEASPRGLDLEVVRRHILEAPGVADVHDLHAWTITSGLNVVSAHVVMEPGADPPAVLDELCRCLSGDFDIEHSTFQLETTDRRRLEERAHA